MGQPMSMAKVREDAMRAVAVCVLRELAQAEQQLRRTRAEWRKHYETARVEAWRALSVLLPTVVGSEVYNAASEEVRSDDGKR